MTTKKESERRPRTPWDNSPSEEKSSVNGKNRLLEIKTPAAIYPTGEEAPEARAGPRSPDVFYRGEEAGAALNPTENNDRSITNYN